MEVFYVLTCGVLLLTNIAVTLASGRRNTNWAAMWLHFLFGWFSAMAVGVPVMHWVTELVAQWAQREQQQPPGKLGGGS